MSENPTIALAIPHCSSNIPDNFPRKHDLFSYLHSLFHISPQNLRMFLNFFFPLTAEDLKYIQQLTTDCHICQRTYPNTPLKPSSFPTHQARGYIPGADWQLVFTNMPRVQKHTYLLVLVDTFSG